jgi:hypothetical protein
MSDPITASEKQAASGRDGLDDSNISSNYAFLVHSQTTIPGNLPPNVDNKALARQKRRRTRYVSRISCTRPMPQL